MPGRTVYISIPGQLAVRALRILVIEDDKDAAAYLAKGLRESGHAVDLAYDGREALGLAAGGAYDVLVVDRMIPGLDGLSLVRTLRSADCATPALFLTALAPVEERVKGLEVGDDYLVKPFAFSELLARLTALARRSAAGTRSHPVRLVHGELEMDLKSRKVQRAGRPIDLQGREFQILEVLLRNAGHVVTRGMLLEQVWDYAFEPQANVIDTHVSRLRQKIDKGFAFPLIHTVRGTGYRLEAETRG